MSKLNAFLKGNKKKSQKTKEYIASEDFIKEDGTPEPFILRKLKGSEIFKIQQAATTDGKVNQEVFTSSLLVACVEYPDLLNQELQDSYEVTTPHALIDAMLEGAEYLKLTKECLKFNGLNQTVEELQKEAKN